MIDNEKSKIRAELNRLIDALDTEKLSSPSIVEQALKIEQLLSESAHGGLK